MIISSSVYLKIGPRWVMGALFINAPSETPLSSPWNTCDSLAHLITRRLVEWRALSWSFQWNSVPAFAYQLRWVASEFWQCQRVMSRRGVVGIRCQLCLDPWDAVYCVEWQRHQVFCLVLNGFVFSSVSVINELWELHLQHNRF